MFTHKPLFTINAEAYWFFFIFLFSDDKFCPKKSFMKYKGHLKIPNVIDYSKDLARQITHVIGIAWSQFYWRHNVHYKHQSWPFPALYKPFS
jgi:hypothetical protein